MLRGQRIAILCVSSQLCRYSWFWFSSALWGKASFFAHHNCTAMKLSKLTFLADVPVCIALNQVLLVPPFGILVQQPAMVRIPPTHTFLRLIVNYHEAIYSLSIPIYIIVPHAQHPAFFCNKRIIPLVRSFLSPLFCRRGLS